MYFGDDTDGNALTNMVLEPISNALDQFLGGHASRIDVIITPEGGFSVSDDGAGIGVHLCDGVPFLQHVLTQMHTGPTADGHRPHEHLGPRGVGLAPVNFLSAKCVVTTHVCRVADRETPEAKPEKQTPEAKPEKQTHMSDESDFSRPARKSSPEPRTFRQHFAFGEPVTAVEDLGVSTARGTHIYFLPDAERLDCSWIDVSAICQRLRELAWLHPALRISFTDQRNILFARLPRQTTQQFHQPRGIEGQFQRRNPQLVSAVFSMRAQSAVIEVQACAGFSAHAYQRELRSYANTQETSEHGVHVEGFLLGFQDALAAIKPMSKRRTQQLAKHLHAMLSAIIVVRLRDPNYANPTTARLNNANVKPIVQQLTASSLAPFLAANPQFVALCFGDASY
jgi:DNA gyrase subunit B